MSAPLNRRDLLKGGTAALVLPPSRLARGAGMRPILQFRLIETAGLKRFGYPVHAVLPIHTDPGGGYRLLQDGRPVSAQFRPVDGPDGRPAIELDFNASPAPLSTSLYSIEHDRDRSPEEPPGRGVRAERTDSLIRVSSGGQLRYEVPDDLAGFLRSTVNGRDEYVRGDSLGLRVRTRDDKIVRLGGGGADALGLRYKLVRQGPMAASIRFHSDPARGRASDLSAVVDMTFPSSKSWVETTWGLDDPEGRVAGMELDLNLQVGDGPTLVDLGAASTVYAALKAGEQIRMTAGDAPGRAPEAPVDWTIEKGAGREMLPFARATRETPSRAEGWAHVMDGKRCTAVAVAGFGRTKRDFIAVDADGRLRLGRSFAENGAAPGSGRKTLTFWLHFVPVPVQVGAVTSPQAMLAPLRVVWEETKPGS